MTVRSTVRHNTVRRAARTLAALACVLAAVGVAAPASAAGSGSGWLRLAHLSPNTPPVDVSAGLAQHIVRFEQAKPVPLQDVLTFMEELLAVSIRGDKHEIPDLDDVLQTPITIQLENTTVRQILKEVLAKAGLTFEAAAGGIRLHKLANGHANGKP